MSFLNDLKKSLGGAADYTVKKTGEVTGTAKLRMDIRQLNGQLVKCFERIGRAYYKNEKGIGETQENIAEIITEADAIREKIAALRAQLAALQGCVICPACGAQISNKSVYCPLCGVKLPAAEKPAPAEEAPVEEAPAEEAPSGESPAGEISAEEAGGEENRGE